MGGEAVTHGCGLGMFLELTQLEFVISEIFILFMYKA